jgi:SH3-like domain-containing protein
MQALNQIKIFNRTIMPNFRIPRLSKPCSSKLSLSAAWLALSLVFSCSAFALEFRSVTPAKAVLYDAPSLEATKLYILNSGYPVEIIVNLGDWLKVRDQLGSLSWIENKHLSAKRTVLTLEKADIKASENVGSALLATVEKDVVLELVSPVIQNGWVKIKHRDGIVGFVQAIVLWGVD